MTARTFYDDGVFQVTDKFVATSRRLYPLVNATARIRRDPLWIGLGVSGLSLLGVGVYGDLLYAREIIGLLATGATALCIGLNVSVLSIDAAGHHRAMIIGRSKKITAIFRGIREARLLNGNDFPTFSAPPDRHFRE